MASAPQLLRDLRLRTTHHDVLSLAEVVQTEERAVVGGRVRVVRDIATIEDNANLFQAIELRLLTPRGELAALGHADYGSRLHELVGSPDTDTSLGLAKLYVIEALKQERRLSKIVDVAVTRRRGVRQTIDILIRVLPIGSETVLEIGPLGLVVG